MESCRLTSSSSCFPIEYSSKCSTCCAVSEVYCNNYITNYAQCSDQLFQYTGNLNWIIITNQGDDIMQAQKDCMFSSNRNFYFDVEKYSSGSYINTMIFTDSLTDTQVTWNCPVYEPMYLTYPISYEPINCPDDDDTSGVPLGLIIGLIVVLLIIICCISYCCYMKFRVKTIELQLNDLKQNPGPVQNPMK